MWFPITMDFHQSDPLIVTIAMKESCDCFVKLILHTECGLRACSSEFEIG